MWGCSRVYRSSQMRSALTRARHRKVWRAEQHDRQERGTRSVDEAVVTTAAARTVVVVGRAASGIFPFQSAGDQLQRVRHGFGVQRPIPQAAAPLP